MSKTTARITCATRGYHRIPARELRCIECGKVLDPQQVLENDRMENNFQNSTLRGVTMIRRDCAACGGKPRGHMHGTRLRVDGPDERIYSMHPLCEPCWASLAPVDRLPYYRAMWLTRDPGPQDLGQWFEIEAAVLAE